MCANYKFCKTESEFVRESDNDARLLFERVLSHYNSSLKTWMNEWMKHLPNVTVVVEVRVDRIERGAENDNASE